MYIHIPSRQIEQAKGRGVVLGNLVEGGRYQHRATKSAARKASFEMRRTAGAEWNVRP
jgi:hypothetical protein